MKAVFTVDADRYDELIHAERMYLALCSAGVDNWEGYEYARDIYQEESK